MNIDIHRLVAIIAAFIFSTTAISAAVLPALDSPGTAPPAAWL